MKYILTLLIFLSPTTLFANDTEFSYTKGKGIPSMEEYPIEIEYITLSKASPWTNFFYQANIGRLISPSIEGYDIEDELFFAATDKTYFFGAGLRYDINFLTHGRFYFSLSPTILMNKDKVGDKDLGTHFQFSSSIGVGVQYQRASLLYKIEHISNGGFAEPNPGIDLHGVEFRISF